MTNEIEVENGHRFIEITEETVESITICFCGGMTRDEDKEEFDKAKSELIEFGIGLLWYVYEGEEGYKQLEEKHKSKILTPEEAVKTKKEILSTIGSPVEGNRYYNINLENFIKDNYNG